MKNSLLFAAVCLFVLQSAFPQVKKLPLSHNVFVSIGYGNTSSENLREYYDILCNRYRYSGIPIPTQTEFGPTLLANTGIIFNLLERIGAGFYFGYLYSPAFSSYKDIGGSIKMNGSINSYDILLNVHYVPFKVGELSIVLSPRVGASHVSVLMTQEVKFNDFQQSNYDWEMTKSGWGLCIQPTVGASINLGEFIVALEGGYRFTNIQVTEQSEVTNNVTDEVTLVMDIGLDGFVSFLSLRIRI